MIKQNPWLEEERKRNLKERYKSIRESEPAEKRYAREKVREAIKKGEIIKPQECEKCGAKKPLHAHHVNGYIDIQIYNIIFICHICHTEIHNNQKTEKAIQEYKNEIGRYENSPGTIVLDD